jgi:hypothetical protein
MIPPSTQDARATGLVEENAALRAALETIANGAKLGTEMFEVRMKGRTRTTWYAVNVLQDNLSACAGTAAFALAASTKDQNDDG